MDLYKPKAFLMEYRLKSNLKHLMDQRKITILALAKSSGVPKSSIHDWLAGSEVRKLHHLKAVCDVFNVTIDEMIFSDLTVEQSKKSRLPESEIVDGVFRVRISKVG